MSEDDRARDMFAAQKLNEKISKELVTETRIPEEAYGYAISREKSLERNQTIKKQSQGHPNASGSKVTIKQERAGLINQQQNRP